MKPLTAGGLGLGAAVAAGGPPLPDEPPSPDEQAAVAVGAVAEPEVVGGGFGLASFFGVATEA